MKKALLTLVMVGIMSSVASAGLVQPVISSLNGQPIDPVSEITIGESDTINFDIISDVQLLTFNLVIEVDGLATLDVSDPTIPDGWDAGFHLDTTELVPGKAYEIGEGNFNGGPQPGIQYDHLLLHCDVGRPANDVIILLRDGAQGGTVDMGFVTPEFGQVIVHQTPEPMTLGLLGLGGLGLIRRRRR